MATSDFSVSLKAFEAKTNKHMGVIARAIALEAFSRVIRRSPVLTGRFKGSWGCVVGGSKTSPVGDGRGASGVYAWNGKGAITMANNLPYAVSLEHGHSKVKAPHGMVRITAAEMEIVAIKIAENLSK